MIMNTDNPLIQTLSMAPSVSVLMGLTVPNVELCRDMLVPSQGYQHGGRKPTKTSVTKFCYENSVNSSLKELMNIKEILY